MNKKANVVFGVFIASGLFIGFFSWLPEKYTIEKIKTVDNATATIDSGFVPNGVFYTTQSLQYSQLQTLGSYTAKGDEQKGTVISPWYSTEGLNDLHFSISGYLNNCELYIENKRFPFKPDTIIGFAGFSVGEKWESKEIKVSEGKFRVIAKDTSSLIAFWVAFSEPYCPNIWGAFKDIAQSMVVFVNVLIIFVYFILFIIPGVLITYRLKLSNRFSTSSLFLLVSFCLSFFVAYIVLIISFFSSIIGIIFGVAIIIVSLIQVVNKYKREIKFKEFVFCKSNLEICLLILFIGLTYVCSLLARVSNFNIDFTSLMSNGTYLVGVGTCDNILPLLFANKIYLAEPFQPFIGDWLASDRPPLFAAGINLLRPLNIFSFHFFYQIFGTFLQLSWVIAFLALGDYLKLKKRLIGFALVFAICSATFINNSMFLWPKLISITPYVLGFIILDIFKTTIIEKSIATTLSILLAWTFVALMLLHGGNVFSLIALCLFFITTLLKQINFKSLVIFGLTVIILYASWILFQKLIDPPGDRLLRWHLADDLRPHDLSHISLLQTIQDYYSRFTLSTWLDNRWHIFKDIYLSHIKDLTSFDSSHFTTLFFHFGSAFYLLFVSFFIFILFKNLRFNKKIPPSF